MMDKLSVLMKKFDFISEIRGMGLLIGIEMNQDVSGEIVGKALEKGLLINAVRPNMIRFMPPLNVSIEEIDQAIEVISEILEDY